MSGHKRSFLATLGWILDSPARLLRHIFSTGSWESFGRGFPETKALIDTAAWPLLALVMLLGMLWSTWWVPKYYAASLPERAINAQGQLALVDKLDAEQNARGLMLQVIGGMVVLVTLYRGIREYNRDQLQRSIDMRHRTEELTLTRENNVADRFFRAIEQLGSEKRDVRIGGILALEMIAGANPEYHWPVLDALAAYLQENTQRHRPLVAEAVANKQVAQLPPMENDIYFALNAITIRNKEFDTLSNSYIDLSNACLFNAAIAASADMSWVDLSNAHLENGRFREVNLYKANLANSSLIACDFIRANLEDARFDGAVLDSASFDEARGLTWEQLEAAASLLGVVLPGYLIADAISRQRAAKHGVRLPA